MHCGGFVWSAGDGSPGLWGSRGPIWGSGIAGWGGWRLVGWSSSPPPPPRQIPIQPHAVWLPSAAVLLGWVQDLAPSLQREGKEAQAELAFGMWPLGPTPGAPAAPMGAEPPSTLSPGRLGMAGGATMVLPLGQDPSLGQIRVPVAFRKWHDRQHLLKMIKSKENHPQKIPRAERFGFPALYNPPGLVSPFPTIAYQTGPLQTPMGMISPLVIPPSSPKFGVLLPQSPSLPSQWISYPGGVPAPGSLRAGI